MKSVSMKWLINARPAIALGIAMAFLVIPGICLGNVFDGKGKPVKLPNILREANEKGLACYNDPSIWQNWIKSKVSGIKPGYENVAEKLKKVSEEFDCHGKRIVWQGTLIQSILETGFFRFKGDAKPENFNIAGVGITLDKEKNIVDNFGKLERGIKAYFQHLCVYASGFELENPIAGRTKIQQRRIAMEVQAWRAKNPNNKTRPITFNDLKASLPYGMNKNSRKFKEFAKHFAGSVEGYGDKVKELSGTGGTTFTWAGDPFYGVKMMSLWAGATKWVEKQCLNVSNSSSPPNDCSCTIDTSRMSGRDSFCNSYTEYLDSKQKHVVYHIVNGEIRRSKNWKPPSSWKKGGGIFNTCDYVFDYFKDYCPSICPN